MNVKKKYSRPGRPINHLPVRNCETGEVFETYTAAGQSVGGSRYGVMKTCWGCQRHHHGVKFEFVRDKNETNKSG